MGRDHGEIHEGLNSKHKTLDTESIITGISVRPSFESITVITSLEVVTEPEQDAHLVKPSDLNHEDNILSVRRHATDPETGFSDLRKDLEKTREEYPPGRSEFFYPINELRRLITPDRIAREIKRSRGQATLGFKFNADTIYTKAPKLFGILVATNLSQHICDLIAEGLGDIDLPLRRCDQGVEVKLCRNKGPMQPIVCMKNWTQQDIHAFNMTQHSFLSPVFNFGEEIPHQNLHDSCRLPFLENHGRGNKHEFSQGGCSSVSKIRIHPFHQTLAGQEYSNASLKMQLKIMSLPM